MDCTVAAAAAAEGTEARMIDMVAEHSLVVADCSLERRIGIRTPA